MICIYCKDEINSKNKSIEHTFPQSFGCPNDWVLNCVCSECNNKFGRTIERWLATDSIEAIKRLRKFGSKSGKRVRMRRMSIYIPKEEKYGRFQGAKLWLDFANTKNVIFPDQIGLFNNKGDREFFTNEDLESPEELSRAKSFSKKSINILASSQAAHDKMIKLTKELGIIKKYDIKAKGGLPEGVINNNKIIVGVTVTIDQEIQRAIAKIAVNYLAKIKGSGFASKVCFDEIRSFINGTATKGRLVFSDNNPILYDESKRFKYFDGHLFTFVREGDQLISKISLFNGLSYTIILTEKLSSIWYPIKSGHSFNVHSRKIVPMFGASKKLLPKLFD